MGRHKTVSQRYSDALTRVSWQDFERLLATWYAGQGYRVEHVGTAESGTQFDGGIDLKLYRDADYVVVQCKHWNVRQVTHNPVHELLGVMLTERATGAVVITSGEFTRAAQAAAAKERRVELIDGAALRQMLGPHLAALVPTPSEDSACRQTEAIEKGPASAARYRTWEPRRRRKRNPLPGIVFAIIAGLVAFYFIRHTIANLATQPAERSAVFIPSPTAPPAVFSPAGPRIRSPLVSSFAPHPVQTRHAVYGQTQMTDGELREWKRKNAAAMKILEKTTPEIPLR
ncbi:MAG TPA: restriction endonuclease [Acidobacteriaceae bacterium]|nr:restriction endonuclease [Acidobacteriaceae bacterium]